MTQMEEENETLLQNRSPDGKTFKFQMTHVHQRLPSSSRPFEEDFHDDQVQSEFFTLANKMRHENILTDVELVVGKQVYLAHRIILSTASEYFMKMFNSPLSSSEHKVELVGVLPEAVNNILGYIYTGSISLNEENIQDILEASSFLFLPRLRERCAKFLKDRLDIENCLQIYNLAKRCSLPYLLECSREFISAIFQEISTHQDFKYLSADELIDIISFEDLSVPSEDFVLETALTWVKQDIYSREKHFEEILKVIHLPFVSDMVLKDLVENDSLLKNNQNLMVMFQSALRFTITNWSSEHQNIKLLEPKNWCSPRRCMRSIPSIIAMGGPTLNLFNSELGKWCEVTKCKPRHCPGMDVVGSLIYIVGGSLQWKRKSTGECFNTETNEWSSIAPMHVPRSNFGLVLLKGKLYAVGGYDGNFPLKRSEVYDPELGIWTEISEMNCARDGACNASDGDALYVVGGYDGNQFLLTSEIYHAETNTWDVSTIPKMKEKRQSGMCSYYNSCIYIIGGYFDNTYHASMEVLDLETFEWSFLSPLPEPRHHAGATAVNGHVFVCGGWSMHIPVSYVDVYSIETDTWQRVASLPTPTMIRCVAVNFPRKSMLNLFSKNSDDIITCRAARLKSMRSLSDSSSNERTSSESDSILTSSVEET